MVHLYLNYGLTFNSSPLFSSYWYRKSGKYNFIKNHSMNIKFYRRFYYTNTIVGVDHSYLIRHVTGEYFPIRLWLFRYLGWVVLSFSFFKPIKSKYISSRSQTYRANKSAGYITRLRPTGSLNRSKVLVYMYLSSLNFFKKKYIF